MKRLLVFFFAFVPWLSQAQGGFPKTIQASRDTSERASANGLMAISTPGPLTGGWDGTIVGKDADARSYIAATARFETCAQLRRMLYLRQGVRYMLDEPGKEGEFRLDPNDTTTPDDGALTFVTMNGLRVKRDFVGPVQVRWFVKTNGVSNVTAELQKAINASQGKDLEFEKQATYVLDPLTLPRGGIHLIGNRSQLKPGSGQNMFFLRTAPGNLAADGTYTTGASNPGTAASRKYSGNIEIEGFQILADQKPISLFVTSGNTANYTEVRDIRIHDNYIRSSSSSQGIIYLAGSNVIEGTTSGRLSNVQIYRNTFENLGYYIGVLADAAYPVGSTSIGVNSNNTIALAEKVKVGWYVQFATAELTPVSSGGNLEGSGTFAKSNAIYRVTGYTPDPANPLHGTLQLQSGFFSSTNGFVADGTNQGLKSPLAKNAWIIPPYDYELPTLLTLPRFNVVSGSSTMTRNDLSIQQNAYALNLYPGLQFSLPSGSSPQVFTIVSVSGNSITVDPVPTASSTGVTPILCGKLSQAIRYNGHVDNLIIENNVAEGGSHFVNGQGGVRGKGLWWDDLSNSVFIRGNHAKYFWMTVEATTGTSINALSLAGIATTAGGTSFLPASPASFRYVSKDVNGDNSPEPYLVSTSTTDANTTLLNSFGVGDVLKVDGVWGFYRIVAIPADYPSSSLTIERFDPASKAGVAGGWYSTVATTGSVVRVYAPELGCSPTYSQLDVSGGNVFEWNIRGGVGGYHVSAGANLITIQNNTFNSCNRQPFELSSNRLDFKGNTVTNYVWRGEPHIPGICSYGTGISAQGAGAFMLLSAQNVVMTSNTLIAKQPGGSTYGNQTGAINIITNPIAPYIAEYLEIYDNFISGVTGRILNPNSSKAIGGVNYPTAYYLNFVFRDNDIITKRSTGVGFAMQLYGRNNVVKNLHITHQTGFSFSSFFEQDTPNPEIHPTYRTVVASIDHGGMTVPLGTSSFATKAIVEPLLSQTDYPVSGAFPSANSHLTTKSYVDGARTTAAYAGATLAAGARVTQTVGLTAALGQFAQASFSASLQGVSLSAEVTALNQVTLTLENRTAASVTLPAGSFAVKVTP